jgi:hypothetical protein
LELVDGSVEGVESEVVKIPKDVEEDHEDDGASSEEVEFDESSRC